MIGDLFLEQTKLTVRVPHDFLENVKPMLLKNNTTITDLIETYLRRIPAKEPLNDAPILQTLRCVQMKQ
jgi:hypothetical protein